MAIKDSNQDSVFRLYKEAFVPEQEDYKEGQEKVESEFIREKMMKMKR